MTRSLSPPIEEKRNTNRQSKRAFCFCLVVLIYFKEEETAKAISNSFFPLKMLRKKNDSQENFVRHSLANTARVARITNLTKF